MSSFPGAYEYNRGYTEGHRHALEEAVQRVEALADDIHASVDWNWDYEADPTGMTRSPWVLMREATAAIAMTNVDGRPQ